MKLKTKVALIVFSILALIVPPVIVTTSSSYFFNPHVLGNLFVGYLIGVLGIFVIDKKVIEKERLYFFFFCMNIFLWLWADVPGLSCKPDWPDLAMKWFKLSNTGVVFISASFYAFTVSFLKLKRLRWIAIAYSCSVVFAILNITTGYFVEVVRWFSWGYYPQWNFYRTIPYFLYFVGCMGLSLYEFFRAYKTSANPRTQNQLKYLIPGFLLCYLGAIDYLPVFGFPIRPYGYIAILVWCSIIAYTIQKHQLMDVNVIVKKTLIYSFVSAALAAVYGGTITLMAHILGGRQGASSAFTSALAAIFITLLFNPLRMRTQRWVERYFPRERLDPMLLQEAAGGFAHEMKRPLSKISLPAEMALMDLDRVKNGEILWEEALPKVEDRLRYIMNQSIDAGYMIEAVRELSSSSSTPLVQVDLRELLERVLHFERLLLEKYRVSVELHLPVEFPKVLGRSRQLEIVFVNLIKNAAEAMSAQPVGHERCIRIEGDSSDGGVTLRVKDTGPGIDPEDLEKTFRSDYTTKGAFGTGMGLYLSHQIIQAHGGTLDVQSQLGQGTEFILRLSTS